jgi:hypothetical protein
VLGGRVYLIILCLLCVLGAVHCFTNVENMTAEYWIMISHLVVGSLPEILHL